MPMTWARGRTDAHFYYSCTTHVNNLDRVPCRRFDRKLGITTNVPADKIEAAVWQLVDSMMTQPDFLAACVGASLSESTTAEPVAADRVSRHEARLKSKKAAWNRCRDVHFDGGVSDEDFAEDRERYTREIANLEDELDRMRSATRERQTQRATLTELNGLSDAWVTAREHLTKAERFAIVRALVRDVTIDRRDNITITGTLSLEPSEERFEKKNGWLPDEDSNLESFPGRTVNSPAVSRVQRT
jgi:hypothetical protein